MFYYAGSMAALKTDFDEKGAMIGPLSADSVSLVIWETEVDDGITSRMPGGVVLRIQP